MKQVKQANANLTVSDNTVVCKANWPKGYRRTRKKGADRPAEAPTVFPGIPASIVPKLPLPPRVTSRASNEKRNTVLDELEAFEKSDRFTFSKLSEDLINKPTRS
jgi:hypothetical protein